jgi:hypothetical protein
MSIVHASIVPELDDHLVDHPAIRDSIKEIEGELYCMRPETLVIVQTSEQVGNSIVLSIAEGLSTAAGESTIRNDLKLAMNIKAAFNKSKNPQWLYLEANTTIDTSIERLLRGLSEHSPKMKYLHIQFPLPSDVFPLPDTQAAAHVIGSVLLGADDRIALIAMGKADDREKEFYTRLQKAVVQKNIAQLDADTHGVGAVGAFETTIAAFIKIFHGTKFESRLLSNESIEDSHVLIADISMS